MDLPPLPCPVIVSSEAHQNQQIPQYRVRQVLRKDESVSRVDREVATSVADQLRSRARQAGWAADPVKWARDVLGVHLWSKQREISESLVHNKRTVVASCHGTGKALSADTLIPTPDGMITMGDIVPGMTVLGSGITPVKVLATTGIHTSERFRITFEKEKGRFSVVASGDHIWPVLSSRDLAMAAIRSKRSGVHLHTGLWHHRAKNMTTHELLAGVHDRKRLTVPAAVPGVTPRGIRWKADAWMSGLFASRGHVDTSGRAALTWRSNDNRKPMPGELLLARSWMAAHGVRTVLSRKKIRANAEWTLSIAGDHAAWALTDADDRAVVRSAHADGEDLGWRIVSVRAEGPGPVQCIQVDAPDSLYLCGEQRIPTHNSMIASVLSCWWVSTRPVGEAIVVSCYTDDTEVLTKNGWKLFKDVRTGPDGDEFATRNPRTKEFEWQHAFDYHEAPWDGEVIDIRGRSTDLRVTPNHRMLTEWGEYRDGQKKIREIFKRADAITHRGARLPALSRWEGKTPETVSFGKYTWDTVDFAAFLGAWIAEGSLGPVRHYTKKGGYGGSVAGEQSEYGGSITLSQERKSKGYEAYRDLLTRMIGQEPCRSADRSWRFQCQDLYRYLEKLGKDHEKYIPTEVKNWGREALEAFLRYYLLGDGWANQAAGKKRRETGEKDWRACTVSKRLADDLQEIAQKVGWSATITERQPRDGGSFGERKILAENCRVGYYLIFGTSRCRDVKPSRSHYKGNVYCVSVPNESLYVRRNGSPVWCGNTAPSFAQVNKILWEEIRRHHSKSKNGKNPMIGRVTQGDEWKTDDGQILAFGRKPPTGDQGKHAFQGIHRRYVLVILDEACGVPEELWTGAEAITTNDGCRILAIGNPDDRRTEFGEAFMNPASAQDWNRISVPARVTPNFTGEKVPALLNEVLVSKAWCAERLRAWGKDDPRYISKVLAEFPEQSKSSLFPPALIASASEDVPSQPQGGVLRLGVDVARFGTDQNVVASYLGTTVKIEQTWTGTDTVSSAYMVMEIAERIREEKKCAWVEIRVDAVGLGAGVVDTLNARAALLKDPWFSVYEMNGSASPPVDVGGSVHGYGNARAYWYDQLRLSMRNRRVKLVDDERVKDDLSMIFYKIKSGKLYIISKEEMRKEYGLSPDFADAVAYATAPVPDGLPAGTAVSQDAEAAIGDFMDGMDDSELTIAPY